MNKSLISTLALLLTFSATALRAEVFVEASETVVAQQPTIVAGRYSVFTMTLEGNTVLNVKLRVAGGLDNAIKVWLLDLANFQRFQANQPFQHWPQASPLVTQAGAFSFTTPQTNVYYLILDNRQSLTTRNASIRVDRSTGRATQASEAQRVAYGAHYAAMKKLFVFDDFDIHIQSCGTVNAFSNPNIVICTELLEDAQAQGVPSSVEFVFYHEVSHSLLNLWRFPLYDNEDAADEFATVILMLLGRQEAALQAAQWWATKSSSQEAQAKLFVDDRHSISAQRARNIVNWLNNKDELTSRWARVMIPNMTTEMLAHVVQSSENATLKPATPNEVEVLEAMKLELRKRERLTAAK